MLPAQMTGGDRRSTDPAKGDREGFGRVEEQEEMLAKIVIVKITFYN